MKRPKKSHLMPIVLGAAALAAYFLFIQPAGAAPGPTPGPTPPPPPPPPPGPAPSAADYTMTTSGGLLTTYQAQVMLKSLGGPAGDSAMASLATDGDYGTATSTAIVHYQVIKGLSQTGVINPATGKQLIADWNQFIASGGTPAT